MEGAKHWGNDVFVLGFLVHGRIRTVAATDTVLNMKAKEFRDQR